MARSLKKGPFVDSHLAAKVEVSARNNDRRVIKTWSRRSTVTPDFVGLSFNVHNGEHGRPQARRVRAHADVRRARGGSQGQGPGGGCAASEEVGRAKK
jgi:hypothetical protein